MKVLTANRLTDGAVVYRGWDKGWTPELDQAERLDDADAAIALAAAEAQSNLLVGPYLVSVDDKGPSGRDRNKERIRARGPTVGHSLDAA